MRSIATAICATTMCAAACLLLSAPLRAQLPNDPQQKAQWLEAVLKNWESVMTQVKTLEADCVRTADDKVYNTKEVYQGKARFMKGENGQPARASLYLVNNANKNVYEHLVLSGQFLYEVAPASKEIRVHNIPVPKPGENVDHNLLALLFGMKAADAQKRYQIDLMQADANYFYLRIEPKLPKDKADFSVAQLALVRATYLPRLLEFQQPNKNVVRWDLPNISTPANQLRPADFQQPQLPAGWKWNQIPADGPGPNKVRSSGK